jgi:hypothetical protein
VFPLPLPLPLYPSRPPQRARAVRSGAPVGRSAPGPRAPAAFPAFPACPQLTGCSACAEHVTHKPLPPPPPPPPPPPLPSPPPTTTMTPSCDSSLTAHTAAEPEPPRSLASGSPSCRCCRCCPFSRSCRARARPAVCSRRSCASCAESSSCCSRATAGSHCPSARPVRAATSLSQARGRLAQLQRRCSRLPASAPLPPRLSAFVVLFGSACSSWLCTAAPAPPSPAEARALHPVRHCARARARARARTRARALALSVLRCVLLRACLLDPCAAAVSPLQLVLHRRRTCRSSSAHDPVVPAVASELPAHCGVHCQHVCDAAALDGRRPLGLPLLRRRWEQQGVLAVPLLAWESRAGAASHTTRTRPSL